MASDIEGNHGPSLDVKDRPQIPLDHQGEDSLPHEGRKPVDFVRSQAGVKRVFLEDQPCRPRRFLLRGWQCVEGFPKGFRCPLRPARRGFRHGRFHVHKPPGLGILDPAPNVFRDVRVFNPADHPFNDAPALRVDRTQGRANHIPALRVRNRPQFVRQRGCRHARKYRRQAVSPQAGRGQTAGQTH
jgi:hypothetical protein